MRPYRQGDILLVPVPKDTVKVGRGRSWETTAAARYVRRKPGEGLILAEGEQSGHHHRVNEPRARLIRRGDRLFLRVPPGDAVVLTHEEHDDVVLPADTTLEVVRQREHVPARRPSRGRVTRASARMVYD